jgi:tetratricopeptide (TPR) repeat protein
MKILIKIFSTVFLLFIFSTAFADGNNYSKGLAFYKKKNYKNAATYLEKYIETQPDPATYYILGYAFYKLKDFEKSKRFFEKAYLIDPNFTATMIPEAIGPIGKEQIIIDKLLGLSGAKQQIAQIMDTSYSTTFQLQLAKIPDEKVRQDLGNIIKDTLNFNRIYPPILKEFQKRYNKNHSLSVMSWLRSPLGEKMTKAELAQTEPSETLIITEFQSLSDKRKGLFEKLVKTQNSTEWLFKVISVSLYELAKGLQPYLDTNEKMTSKQLEASIEEALNAMPKEQFTLSLTASYAYSYRTLSDEDLEAAIKFYESPAGKWFNFSFGGSFVTGIGSVSRECGKRLGRYMEEIKKQKQGT